MRFLKSIGITIVIFVVIAALMAMFTYIANMFGPLALFLSILFSWILVITYFVIGDDL